MRDSDLDFSFLDSGKRRGNSRPPTLQKNSSTAAWTVVSKIRAKLATLDRAVDGIALTVGYLLPAIVYTVQR